MGYCPKTIFTKADVKISFKAIKNNWQTVSSLQYHHFLIFPIHKRRSFNHRPLYKYRQEQEVSLGPNPLPPGPGIIFSSVNSEMYSIFLD
jgi:hypothetical protein